MWKHWKKTKNFKADLNKDKTQSFVGNLNIIKIQSARMV